MIAYNTYRHTLTGLSVCALTAILMSCGSGSGSGRAPVDVKGSDPNKALERAGSNTLNNDVIVPADENGIVTYDGYQTIVARNGDTVTSVAERIDLSATQLGAYNGLSATHRLQTGDELVLPPRPGGYGPGGPRAAVSAPATPLPGAVATATVPSPQTAPIEQRPLSGVEVSTDGSLANQTVPESPVPTSDETVVAATDPAAQSAPAWSPDLAAAAIARSSGGIRNDGTLGAPPSAKAPVPEEPTTETSLKSPDLGQYQTPGAQTATPPPAPRDTRTDEGQDLAAASPAQSQSRVKMQAPVRGPVAIGFNKGSGPARNDGVDFAAPAGAPVVAAADGEVALVSESLGGLGTILLLRHPNDLLTVYGRIDGVLVKKGDIVSKGQQVGVVSNAAAPAEPRMHFEVRRGSESLDPMAFL